MNILILTTYPTVNPFHGGQHRVKNIADMLRHNGHSVTLRGILGSNAYPATAGYLNYPGQEALTRYLPKPALMEDWALGRYALDEDGGYAKLAGLCAGQYDLVFCEHPWLFAFVHKHFANSRRRPKLVYSSHNIEHRLKFDIASQYLTPATAKQFSEMVEEAELFAARASDLIIAVSEDDREWLSTVSDNEVVVAPNGVVDRQTTVSDVRESGAMSLGKKFALFCASSHPPNIEGFFDIFGSGVGCLAPGEKMVCAGGAGASIVGDRRFARSSGLSKKFVAAGEVPDAMLGGLLTTAHVIILPISQGGGTNLKTAEAIWSGRHVVATRTSMRGFDEFCDARGIEVVDSASEFQAAIRRAMQSPPLQLTAAERQARTKVLWASTLSALADVIESRGKPIND